MGWLDSILGGVGSLIGDANSGISSLNNFFQGPTGTALSTLGSLGLSGWNAYDQYQRQQALSNPYKNIGPIPPSAQENIKQAVEGQFMGRTGNATPALEAQGLANADWQYQLAAVQNYIEALKAAGAMQSPTGSLEQLFAQLTGGLGGKISSSSGGVTPDADPPNGGFGGPFAGASDPGWIANQVANAAALGPF